MAVTVSKALVVGASSGIGEAIALELAAQGARRPLVKKAASIDQALAEIRGQRSAEEALR